MRIFNRLLLLICTIFAVFGQLLSGVEKRPHGEVSTLDYLVHWPVILLIQSDFWVLLMAIPVWFVDFLGWASLGLSILAVSPLIAWWRKRGSRPQPTPGANILL